MCLGSVSRKTVSNLGRHVHVGQPDLKFEVEVRARAEAAQDHAGSDLAAVLDEQTIERLDPDLREVGGLGTQHGDALIGRQHAPLGGIGSDRQDHLVKETTGAAHHVQVTEGQGIEGPGIDRRDRLVHTLGHGCPLALGVREAA